MSKLRIIFIDDRTDLIESIVNEVRGLGADAEAFDPEEVTENDLDTADLVLLDLDLGTRQDAADVSPLMRPHDGLGFAQVVRSYHRARHRSGAVALLSDKLPRLFGLELPHPSEHEIARLHGLEWAFDKNVSEPGPAERIIALATATIEAAQLWNPESVPEDLAPLAEFLKLPASAPWKRHARALLGATQPPAHNLAASTRGLSVVRWLAQRILPYPGLLISDRHAAVLLGATPDSFVSNMQGTELARRLDQARYIGSLNGFLGRRWWTSAVQGTVIELTGGSPVSDPAAIDRLNEDTGADLVSTPGRSVVALDADLRTYASPVGRHEVVRIRPDDWPVFAEPGYAPISLFEDEDDDAVRRLRSYVEPADVAFLSEAAGE